MKDATAFKLGEPIHLSLGFDEAVSKLHHILGRQGFVAVSALDLRGTFKIRFNQDIQPFTVLSVYHADVIRKLLAEKPEAAIWLPWNLSVTHKEGKTLLTIPNPLALTMFMEDDPVMKDIASDLKARFNGVAEAFSEYFAQ